MISIAWGRPDRGLPEVTLEGSSSISVVNRVLAPRLLSTGMPTQLRWSAGPGVKVLGITLEDEENWVVSAAAKPIGISPDRGTRSRHWHGWHSVGAFPTNSRRSVGRKLTGIYSWGAEQQMSEGLRLLRLAGHLLRVAICSSFVRPWRTRPLSTKDSHSGFDGDASAMTTAHLAAGSSAEDLLQL
ncbi:hypothetical protein GA0061102_102981 [Rhizobium miluonense]|uniref:Uncharacterized protein n=1 Tax=Rhizobium miluonense TaxID=411945 RepID=A0A1C3WH77_9HYPH|nr:hypothetical protein GA0061102_102981 [Rhizobium miluonense]